MDALYDTIGGEYAAQRKADPRISRAIAGALGQSRTLINVGAGTGLYEPADRTVVAVEPSRLMIKQRPNAATPVTQASAESLPFADKSFDASMAILTMHHWQNQALGLSELRRVSRQRAVIFTWDPKYDKFWLTDYLPEILEIDRALFPTLRVFSDYGKVTIQRLPIPNDCVDGFLCCYWSRPHAYLDPSVRAAMSTFSKLTDADTGLARLERDLATGAWDKRYPGYRRLPHLDLGYAVATIEF